MTIETDAPARGAHQPRALRVSIVIPVKDDASELARCLAALSAQTRPADEIIVVDNGSTDASASVAALAGVTLVHCAEPGIPAASARGYDHATGDLILRLDADCVPDEHWVRDLEQAFADRPDVAAFTGGARFGDGPEWLRRPLADTYLLLYALVVAPALGHLPLFGSNMGIRREVWDQVRADVHRHDDRIHDDLDLAFHVGARHRIRYIGSTSMEMSMRPFASAGSMRVRVGRGFRTVAAHWPREFPPLRWARRAVHRRAARVDRATDGWGLGRAA